MRQESYLNRPLSCAVDAAGDLIFADFNHRLRTRNLFRAKGPPQLCLREKGGPFYKRLFVWGFCLGGTMHIDIVYIYVLIHIYFVY